MRTRGYPVDDFNRRADDISVDHPNVVRHYREARSVRDASSDGSVDTERQRGALTSYRSLVEELLGRDRTAQADGRGTGTGETDHREHRADTDDRDRGADNTERAHERR
jgi:hypothetical protein